MENRAFKDVTDYMKKEASEKGYDDWNLLTDEELLSMNPISEDDKEFLFEFDDNRYSTEDIDRLLELEKELKRVLQDIKDDEDLVKKEKNYMARAEVFADIRDSRMKEAKILREMEAIKSKYERDNRSL